MALTSFRAGVFAQNSSNLANLRTKWSKQRKNLSKMVQTKKKPLQNSPDHPLEVPRTSSKFLEVPRSSSKFLEVPRTPSKFLEVPRTSSVKTKSVKIQCFRHFFALFVFTESSRLELPRTSSKFLELPRNSSKKKTQNPLG